MKESIAPDAYVLLAVKQQKWSFDGALYEFIDNSFGKARGNAQTVTISWNWERGVLDILDDGQGMTNVKNILQLGNTSGSKGEEGDIGYFGWGGTKGLIYLSFRTEVFTLRDGKVATADVDWRTPVKINVWPTVDTAWRTATRANCPQELLDVGHGTLLRLYLYRERFLNARVREVTLKRLSQVYAKGLRDGRHIIWKQPDIKKAIELQPWEPPKLRDVVEFKVVMGNPRLQAMVRVGWSDEITLDDSWMLLNYGFRQVKRTKEAFGEYEGGRVFGWIDLNEAWRSRLSSTKDDIDDSQLRSELMECICKEIQPLLERMENESVARVLLNIKWNLMPMINGLSRIIRRGETGTPGVLRLEEATEGGDDLGTGDTADNPTSPPSGDETKGTDKHNLMELDIKPHTDKEMKGQLCTAEIRESARMIVIHVNREHSVTKEALSRRGTNRPLLYYMIAEALAKKIAANERYMRALFTAAEFTQLQETTNNGDALALLPYITRRLIDAVQT